MRELAIEIVIRSAHRESVAVRNSTYTRARLLYGARRPGGDAPRASSARALLERRRPSGVQGEESARSSAVCQRLGRAIDQAAACDRCSPTGRAFSDNAK